MYLHKHILSVTIPIRTSFNCVIDLFIEWILWVDMCLYIFIKIENDLIVEKLFCSFYLKRNDLVMNSLLFLFV